MPEFVAVEDFVSRIQRRIKEIEASQKAFDAGQMDTQEERERLEYAEALLGESERHYINYVEENVRTSAEANDEIRRVQQETWKVFQEDAPPNYADKQAWQSKVVIPKPHAAVQFAMAAVKNAFSPNFLSVTDKRNPKLAEFWRRLLDTQLDREHGKFVTRFTVASGMGFAVGQSFEMIPLWRPGRGLDFTQVEPWKVSRDPDALSMDPQSGMYWIHEEWQDLWLLRQQEREGRYVNTDRLQGTAHEETNPQNWRMSRQQQADLRRQHWNRNQFRTTLLTREFWGTMLDRRGELLHPRLTYTVAGNRVISLPRPTPYPSLRWPGVSFSPLPNFLRFEGRSLLQSIRSLWYFMCNLQALHIDYLNWQVNPMREITQGALLDHDDIDPYPGRVWLTKQTVSGNQVVRTIDHRFTTNEVLANMQNADNQFREGTFITSALQGLPGYRLEITARESAQNLQQAQTVFGVMGENLDFGAVDVLKAVIETIQLNITQDELLNMFDLEELMDYFGPSEQVSGWPAVFVLTPDQVIERFGELPEDFLTSPTGVVLPSLTGTFHVSGLQSILKDFETMHAIQNIIIPMLENPFFQPFVRPDKVAKAIEVRANLQDEELLVSEEEAEQIVQTRKQSEAALAQMQQEILGRQQKLAEAQMELEAEKVRLEGEKLTVEARKVEVEAEVAALEYEQKQAEVAGNVAGIQADLDQKGAQILKMRAEIAHTEAQIGIALAKTLADLEKSALGVEKTRQQMDLAERKVRVQERVAMAQIRAAKRGQSRESSS